VIQEFSCEDKSSVRSIWANAQLFIIGHESGLLEVFKWNSTEFEFSLEIKYEYPLKAI
jgi:hypothetical protein